MENNHQTSIAQMMEITNCSESVAIDYLSQSDYNVETAIRHFFEGTSPAATPRGANMNQRSVSPSSSNITTEPGPSTSQAVLPRYHTMIQLFANLITFPVRFPLMIINIIYEYFFGQPTKTYSHIFDYIKSIYPVNQEKMESVFYSRHLQNLRTDIQVNNWKWLVAYIHNPKGNQTFFESLFHSDFVQKVEDRGGVFFGAVMGSDDASRLRPDRAFGRNRKSCVIIFVIRGNSLTRKLLIEDLSNPEAVATNVDLALIDLIADEAERETQEMMRRETRSLMEEQNREYEESLQRDLERIEKAKSEEAALKKAQEEEEQRLNESKNRIKRVEDYKNNLQTTDNDGACELLIRYPSGKKVIKFNDDENIELLFEKALNSDLCPLFFQMHQNYPKRAVPCLPEWYFTILKQENLEPKEACLSNGSTFREAGISHGAMVYIDNL